jgi:hypothetical protein
MTRLLESRALDGLQATTEQIALFLDFTARDCGELQLRVAQVGDVAEVTVLGQRPVGRRDQRDDGHAAARASRRWPRRSPVG